MKFINEVGQKSKDRWIHPWIEKIGGHCVIENAQLFLPYSIFAQLVIEKNDSFGLEYPGKHYNLTEPED